MKALSQTLLLSFLLLPCVSVISQIAPQTFTPQQEAFFENKVRPLIAERCYSCHTGKEPKGGLLLDSREALLKGNASGPALVPGNVEKSLLVHAIRYTGKVKMPPAGSLQQDEIRTLTEWVKMGAPWGKATAVGAMAPKGTVITPEQRQFWSFVRPTKQPAPVTKNRQWAKNPIDAFILSKLEAKGLKPAPFVGRRALIRRATFDLTGLPPTPKEVEDFLKDTSANAFEKVIERLQASPQYGERWGRYWLDLVRYSDSNGLDENKAFAHAFRYRDYVVRSFVADKPYNQFIIEQLAGDLLPTTNDEALRNDRLTATGFLVLGPKVLAEQDKPKMVMDIVDEQIEVSTKAFLGMTVACARCHNHKFDPIPTKDYYAIAGIFKSTRTMSDLGFVSNWMERPVATAKDRELTNQFEAKRKELDSTVATAKAKAHQALLARLWEHSAGYLRAGWEIAAQGGLLSQADAPRKPGDVLVEAESFARGNVARDAENFGKGIGVVHTVQSPNFAEWDIEVSKAGNYQVEFRYAAQESRPMRLLINGKKVSDAVCGTVTGGWYPENQRWEPQATFALKVGKNVLRIEQDSNIPHLDKILVVPAIQSNIRKLVRPVEIIAKEQDVIGEIARQIASTLGNRSDDPVFGAFLAFAQLPEAEFENRASALAIEIEAGRRAGVNPAVRRLFAGFRPKSLSEVADRYGSLIDSVLRQSRNSGQNAKLSNSDEEAVRQALFQASGLIHVPEKPERFYSNEEKQEVAQAQNALDTISRNAPKMPVAMAVEEGKIENCRVHIRGNTLTLGEEAPRGALQVLGGMPSIENSRSGRLELAQWMASPTNPLTARVAVNRVWQYLFGEGIVRTPENFGFIGDRPVYPQLLDWLAVTFVEQGWSFKRMQKLIMLSNTYKMSGVADPKAMLVDPDNRLFWRKPRRRLEAEPLRDSLLAVSGQLDSTMGGSLLTTPNNDYVTNDQSGNAARYSAPRRSIYMPIIRNALFDMFQAFDYGDPSIVNAKRASTTVAPQALYLMNSPFAIEQSKHFAKRLLDTEQTDKGARLNLAYMSAFGRPPTYAEITAVNGYLDKLTAYLTPKEPDAIKREMQVWSSLCHALMASNEFLYVD